MFFVITVGMAMVIVTGGIDLSIGSVAAFPNRRVSFAACASPGDSEAFLFFRSTLLGQFRRMGNFGWHALAVNHSSLPCFGNSRPARSAIRVWLTGGRGAQRSLSSKGEFCLSARTRSRVTPQYRPWHRPMPTRVSRLMLARVGWDRLV